mmetsp:Transcript_70000/g.192160  ORF Transcript_70000/g.192160 Transcript_70000/m.192160 type:complete len:204 (-) Transcript_70000:276-887(-)
MHVGRVWADYRYARAAGRAKGVGHTRITRGLTRHTRGHTSRHTRPPPLRSGEPVRSESGVPGAAAAREAERDAGEHTHTLARGTVAFARGEGRPRGDGGGARRTWGIRSGAAWGGRLGDGWRGVGGGWMWLLQIGVGELVGGDAEARADEAVTADLVLVAAHRRAVGAELVADLRAALAVNVGHLHRALGEVLLVRAGHVDAG